MSYAALHRAETLEKALVVYICFWILVCYNEIQISVKIAVANKLLRIPSIAN